MSYLTEFIGDCPLTVTNLVKWLRRLVERMDKKYEISKSFLQNLYAMNQGASITISSTISTINEIVDAIDSGKTLICSNGNISIIASTCTCIESDNYESFEICVVGEFGNGIERIVFGVENISGSVRLYKKSVTEV